MPVRDPAIWGATGLGDQMVDPPSATRTAETMMRKWTCANCLPTELHTRGMPNHPLWECSCRCSKCFRHRGDHHDSSCFGPVKCKEPMAKQEELPDYCNISIRAQHLPEARRVMVTWWRVLELASGMLSPCRKQETQQIGMNALMKACKLLVDNPYEPEGLEYKSKMINFNIDVPGDRLVTFYSAYLDHPDCPDRLHQYMREGQIMEVLVGPKENSLNQDRRRWEQMMIVCIKEDRIWAQLKIQSSNTVFNEDSFRVRPSQFIDTDYKIALAILLLSDYVNPDNVGPKPGLQPLDAHIEKVFGKRELLSTDGPFVAREKFINTRGFRDMREKCRGYLRDDYSVKVPPTETQLDAITAAQFPGLQLVHGPGGCGKTLVLAYALACKVRHDPNAHIGVFCKSNTACDDVLRVYNDVVKHAMFVRNLREDQEFGNAGFCRFLLAIRVRSRCERTRIHFLNDSLEEARLLEHDFNRMIVHHPYMKVQIAPHEHERYVRLAEKVQTNGFSVISDSDREFMQKHRRKWSIAIRSFRVHICTLGNVEANIFENTFYSDEFFDEASVIRFGEVYPCIVRSLVIGNKTGAHPHYAVPEMRLKTMVVIGDPKQMAPISFSDDPVMRGLQTTSLYDYMYQKGVKTFILNDNFRMFPSISELPRRLFYQTIGLKDSAIVANLQANTTVTRQESAMLSDAGADYRRDHVRYFREKDQRSVYLGVNRYGHDVKNRYLNFAELNVVLRLVLSLTMHGEIDGRPISPDRIAVLTFYTRQMVALRLALEKLKRDGLIKAMPTVMNIVMAQGREFDVVILSTVNTYFNASNVDLRPTSFLKGPNQLCVALTRAKYGQFIIGGTLNSTYMEKIKQSSDASQEPYYQMQVYYYEEKGWYYDVPADSQ